MTIDKSNIQTTSWANVDWESLMGYSKTQRHLLDVQAYDILFRPIDEADMDMRHSMCHRLYGKRAIKLLVNPRTGKLYPMSRKAMRSA